MFPEKSFFKENYFALPTYSFALHSSQSRQSKAASDKLEHSTFSNWLMGSEEEYAFQSGEFQKDDDPSCFSPLIENLLQGNEISFSKPEAVRE